MKFCLLAVFVSILLVSSIFAQESSVSQGGDSTLARVQEAAAQLGIKDINGGAIEDVKGFFSNMNDSERELWRTKSMVVIGSQLSATEKASWALLKEKFPELKDVQLVQDTPENYDKIKNAQGPVVFVGGPSQNYATKLAGNDGLLQNDIASSAGFLDAQMGTTPNGQKILVVSDTKGYNNLAKDGAKYSPLAAVIPQEYVPVAASGISVLLMLILQALMPFAQSIGEERIIDLIGAKKVKLAKETKMVFGIRVREIVALVLASIVIAAAVTYVFTGPTAGFINLFGLNFVICVMTEILYTVINALASKRFNIESEYVFWAHGGALTLLSAVLGNPFGLAGFLFTPEEEEEPKDKTAGAKKEEAKAKTPEEHKLELLETRNYAIVAFLPPLACIMLATVLAAINFFAPSEFLQMGFTILSFVALLDFLPIAPLAGKDIVTWNVFVWALFFFPTLGLYVMMNYVI